MECRGPVALGVIVVGTSFRVLNNGKKGKGRRIALHRLDIGSD